MSCDAASCDSTHFVHIPLFVDPYKASFLNNDPLGTRSVLKNLAGSFVELLMPLRFIIQE